MTPDECAARLRDLLGRMRWADRRVVAVDRPDVLEQWERELQEIRAAAERHGWD